MWVTTFKYDVNVHFKTVYSKHVNLLVRRENNLYKEVNNTVNK